MAIPKQCQGWTGDFPLHKISPAKLHQKLEQVKGKFKGKYHSEPTTIFIHPDEEREMGLQAARIPNMFGLELRTDSNVSRNGFILCRIKNDTELTR